MAERKTASILVIACVGAIAGDCRPASVTVARVMPALGADIGGG